MKSKVTVQLSSDLFGNEYFHYDSLDAAIEGIKRLYASCAEKEQADGIPRTVGLCIGEVEDE